MTKREPIEGGLAPEHALLHLRGERGAFALVGEWAGVRAILGSEPVRVATPDDDPFAVFDDLPDVGEPDSGAVVGGGWFGWLGYGLGSRVERLPPSPPVHAAVAPWRLAYHDHVVVFDGERWWFEALWTSERDAALRERLGAWRARLGGPAPEPRPVAVGPG
ncbi:MAG TPA: hypothetical protein VHB30_10455, partial [Solirubrobacteraceae bacterium]|nr:hypothetical protein [Solirubrobacteraceae bacterium]